MSEDRWAVPFKVFELPENCNSDEEVFDALKVCDTYKAKQAKTNPISKNEEFDDISTSAIGYLVLDYIIAQLYGKFRDNRVKAIEMSQKYYIGFLNEMSRLLFVKKSVVDDLVNNVQLSSENARTQRVSRYRESKDAKNKLEILEKKRKAGFADEEEEREFFTVYFRVAILESLDNYNYQQKEFDMLKEVEKMKKNGTFEETKRRDDLLAEKSRTDFKTFTIPKQGAPIEQPAFGQQTKQQSVVDQFVYKPERLEIQKNVFNPRFKYGRLMTDEDFKEEMRTELAPKDPNPEKTSADEDSDRETDESLKDKRDWDEFKDQHPKGSGNTLNMG
ncbi:hypothetical protein EIN_379730 [Entamoeba invadens IP1]|uniref:Uncharacterized protein n=1 Tax=Entamoeba invadens IP1 TaxID=370355 RepID=A0A0A1UE83_ENTIV|nr:hypothetical protein EIN_379730 [Entamoeba invadens IP1]ELP92086.1 hypothetical protein EIN_379730 [Entamoeba invadens IP1]|eukprot:XP_004258857.1 hypothetical protein EIN_379730 [Entamoeba invadens IP1]